MPYGVLLPFNTRQILDEPLRDYILDAIIFEIIDVLDCISANEFGLTLQLIILFVDKRLRTFDQIIRNDCTGNI